MSSSAHRSFPTGMVALLGLGLIGIGLWYFAALQPVAVKAIPPTARADPVVVARLIGAPHQHTAHR